jgi:hypothetical protein
MDRRAAVVMLGGSLTIIGYFLTWIAFGGLGATSAFDLTVNLSHVTTLADAVGVLALLLLPLCGLLAFLFGVRRHWRAWMAGFFGVPTFVWLVLRNEYYSSQTTFRFEYGIGFWISLIGVGLIFFERACT